MPWCFFRRGRRLLWDYCDVTECPVPTGQFESFKQLSDCECDPNSCCLHACTFQVWRQLVLSLQALILLLQSPNQQNLNLQPLSLQHLNPQQSPSQRLPNPQQLSSPPRLHNLLLPPLVLLSFRVPPLHCNSFPLAASLSQKRP